MAAKLLPVIRPARTGYRGLKAGRGVIIAGFLNKIMAASSRLSPTPVTLRIANRMMSTGK
jgi:short-subunit dehydrogenase